MVERPKGFVTLNQPFKAHIIAMPPDSRHRDLDNLIKVILDFAQGAGIVTNDKLCTDLRIRWGAVDEAPLGARLILDPA